jgi:hypothetical protein
MCGAKCNSCLASSHAIAKRLPQREPHDAERDQAKVPHVISSVDPRGGGNAADQRGLHNRAV